MSAFLTIFVTVFLAELGDKTQLATALFASDGARQPWLVFAASALALTASAGAATFVGANAAHLINGPWLRIVAGIGFIVIGAMTLWPALRAVL